MKETSSTQHGCLSLGIPTLDRWSRYSGWTLTHTHIHKQVMVKLEQNSISGNLLNTLRDFLSNRKQRVVINGQVTIWTSVNAGVPQGSISDTLLLLIYINDLPKNVSSNIKLFADDTFESARELNEDLKKSVIGLSNGKKILIQM